MIKTIWKKEILSHLTSHRFTYCTLVIVSLMWIIGLLRITGYEKALSERDLIVAEIANEVRATKFYSSFWTKIVRTPRPLEVFDSGVTEKMASIVPIEVYKIPYISEKNTISNLSNPLLAIIGTFDVIHVIQVFLSLLAILLSCEAISGEKEEGTLSLMLTMNVSRMQVVMGKFLSGITVLNIPILLGFLGLAVFLGTSEHVRLTGEDWAGLIGIWVMSLFYIAIFYLIGLVVSCCTYNTSTSLIYGLFIWAFLVIILPSSVMFFVNQQFHRLENALTVEDIEKELWREYQQRVDNLVRTAGVGDTYPPMDMVDLQYENGPRMTGIGYGSNPGFQLTNIQENAALAKFLDLLRTGEHLRLQYAQKIWNECRLLREDHPRSLIRLNDQLRRVTPAGAYLEVSSGLAGTDADSFYHFINQAREYRKHILDYMMAHDAFGQREFFNDEGEGIDLSDLPAFQERRESISIRLDRIAPGLLVLFLYAGLMWLAAIGLFARYDVTR